MLQFLLNRNEKCMHTRTKASCNQAKSLRCSTASATKQQTEACKVKATQPSILGHFASRYAISTGAPECLTTRKAASNTRCIHPRKHSLPEKEVQQLSAKRQGLTGRVRFPARYLLPGREPQLAGAAVPPPGLFAPRQRAATESKQCPASRSCRSAQEGQGQPATLSQRLCAEGKASQAGSRGHSSHHGAERENTAAPERIGGGTAPRPLIANRRPRR